VLRRVNALGDPIYVDEGITPNHSLVQQVSNVENGIVIGGVNTLAIRDPQTFHAGELHSHTQFWTEISARNPSHDHQEVLNWINNKVSVFPYFQHFKGIFQQESYDSDFSHPKQFPNNKICAQFRDFIGQTIVERLVIGAFKLIERVGEVEPPHLVLPLTVEPRKPRLCYEARFLNLWMKDKPFKLDSLRDLPRYVSNDSYQTVLDDKSGYDHIFLTEASYTYFGFQWAGWYFTCCTLPFGWKISPYVYHSTGLLGTHFFVR
jgi:hypothetical protein